MAIEVKSRADIVAHYKRSYRLRQPGADVRDGTQPHIDAVTIGDQLVPVYANCQQLERIMTLEGRVGDEVDEVGEAEGVTRYGATGARGFASVQTGSSGSSVSPGDELEDESTGTTYRAATTGTVAVSDGEQIPVEAADTGPGTDRDAGTILTWKEPRPGMLPDATVVSAADGTGLSGGREAEPDGEYKLRITEARRMRSTAGNAAAYINKIYEAGKELGIPVQAAFAYPAPFGPGSIAVVFTLAPSALGASRVPNAAQRAEIIANVAGKMPGDDSAFDMTILDHIQDVSLEVRWSAGADGWANLTPWPPRYELNGTPGQIAVSSATSATEFQLVCTGGDYTGAVAPQAGDVFGVWDGVSLQFRRKTVATVSGSGPWNITCETAANASDVSYQPVVGALVSPWSDSLQAVVEPVLAHFATLGPGEIYATPPGDGIRRERFPRPSPKRWPNRIDFALANAVASSPAVDDVTIVDGDGDTASVGVPGVSVRLQKLYDLAIYPKA